MSDIIHLLPDAIANQIAAGEVVQRPASVVKELLENSVDAGAEKITLILEGSGKRLIQVIDDGQGMSEYDARMSFERHATSKIRKVDDLFAIKTFGFRGEALASIAAVARVNLKTRRAEDELGTEVRIQDSRVEHHEPCAQNVGSSISVRNLFFNVPARKNFLKSDKVEMRHILDEFHRAALAHPEIAFSCVHDGADIYHLKAGTLKKRIVQLFGRKYEEGLIAIDEKSDIIEISGFVLKPELARKSRGEQFFFANNRFIKSPYCAHAIQNAFGELLQSDHYAGFFINFKVDPARIDVNVHPTKTEVKFEDEKAIYAILKASVRKALADHHVGEGLNFDDDRLGFEPENQKPPSWIEQQPSYGKKSDAFNWQQLYEGLEKKSDSSSEAQQMGFPDREEGSAPEKAGGRTPFQLFGKFLISVVRSGMLIIHQQWAHERILFERFLRDFNGEQLKGQAKLFPEVIEFSASDLILFDEMRNSLEKLGFDFQPFGKRAFLLNALPAFIPDQKAEDLFKQLFAFYKTAEGADSLSYKERLARSLAKTAAIKSGKHLQREEVAELIDQLFACEKPLYGLDGQKCVQTIEEAELDDKFGLK